VAPSKLYTRLCHPFSSVIFSQTVMLCSMTVDFRIRGESGDLVAMLTESSLIHLAINRILLKSVSCDFSIFLQ